MKRTSADRVRHGVFGALALLGLGTTFFMPEAGAAVIPITPQIPPQSGGPPLAVRTFERTADLSGISLGNPLSITLHVTRNGDFNNPTTDMDPNGAPPEGIAVIAVSQPTAPVPGSLAYLSFEPGIAGTVHDIGDDPVNRQSFTSPVTQAALINAFDGQFAHFLIVIGDSVDDLSYFDASLTINPVPEPASWSAAVVGILTTIWLMRNGTSNREARSGARIPI